MNQVEAGFAPTPQQAREAMRTYIRRADVKSVEFAAMNDYVQEAIFTILPGEIIRSQLEDLQDQVAERLHDPVYAATRQKVVGMWNDLMLSHADRHQLEGGVAYTNELLMLRGITAVRTDPAVSAQMDLKKRAFIERMTFEPLEHAS